jgi:hypothetical protein
LQSEFVLVRLFLVILLFLLRVFYKFRAISLSIDNEFIISYFLGKSFAAGLLLLNLVPIFFSMLLNFILMFLLLGYLFIKFNMLYIYFSVILSYGILLLLFVLMRLEEFALFARLNITSLTQFSLFNLPLGLLLFCCYYFYI